jgi:hypothetical protein
MPRVQLEGKRAQITISRALDDGDLDSREAKLYGPRQPVEAVDEPIPTLAHDHGERRPRGDVLHQCGNMLGIDSAKPGLQTRVDNEISWCDGARIPKPTIHKAAPFLPPCPPGNPSQTLRQRRVCSALPALGAVPKNPPRKGEQGRIELPQ